MDRVVPPFPVNANHSHQSCGVLGTFHQHSPGRERYSNLATFACIVYRWNWSFQLVPRHH